MTTPTYREYVADAAFMEEYKSYQKRFARTPRQTDLRAIELIRPLVAPALAQGGRPRVLDIGCSAGNLLLHLQHLVPGLELVGGDLVREILQECRCNPDLAGIRFEEMNILDLPAGGEFNVIVSNAVLFLFDEAQFRQALGSVQRALTPGGWLFAFDFFHPFEQDISLVETTKDHPEGLPLHFRPYSRARTAFLAAGFLDPTFHPFEIGIDLGPSAGPQDLCTYTRRTDTGQRLQFRGTLYQPWCHLLAQRPPCGS